VGVLKLGCTTQQHNAHRTEEREVFYPWHPWFGLRVFVHDVMTRGSTRTFRCAETADGAARCLEIPEWMFDRVACCGLAQAESPRVDRAALDRLKALIFEVSGGACVAMLEARRRPCRRKTPPTRATQQYGGENRRGGTRACTCVQRRCDCGLAQPQRPSTGHGNRWTRERVTSLRSHYEIPVYQSETDDEVRPHSAIGDRTPLSSDRYRWAAPTWSASGFSQPNWSAWGST
jgi:hypothetical protein